MVAPVEVVLTSTAGRAVPGSGRVSSTAGVGGKPPNPQRRPSAGADVGADQYRGSRGRRPAQVVAGAVPGQPVEARPRADRADAGSPAGRPASGVEGRRVAERRQPPRSSRRPASQRTPPRPRPGQGFPRTGSRRPPGRKRRRAPDSSGPASDGRSAVRGHGGGDNRRFAPASPDRRERRPGRPGCPDSAPTREIGRDAMTVTMSPATSASVAALTRRAVIGHRPVRDCSPTRWPPARRGRGRRSDRRSDPPENSEAPGRERGRTGVAIPRRTRSGRWARGAPAARLS